MRFFLVVAAVFAVGLSAMLLGATAAVVTDGRLLPWADPVVNAGLIMLVCSAVVGGLRVVVAYIRNERWRWP